MTTIPEVMKAIVFHGPFDIRTDEKPTPKICHPDDVILKVRYAGICGTDLHSYRGHIKGPVDTIIGHEFLGTIVAKGENIDDSKFKINDEVISCFSIQCGKCWYCKHGYTGQCDITNTFGKIGLDGGQAEYVRIPMAQNVLIPKPISNDNIDDSVYLLMADIFLTGYFGVKKILDFMNNSPCKNVEQVQTVKNSKILQIGVGPVGMCALRVLKYYGFENIVVVDSVPSRLEEAKRLGASKIINFETETDSIQDYIKNNTENGGFDFVLEAVGAPSALRTAFDSVRRNGFISSIGMAHGPLPFEGLECYLKNINISFGRCHAWSLFSEALEIFEILKPDFEKFIDYKYGFADSKKAFDLFDKHKIGKGVLDTTIN